MLRRTAPVIVATLVAQFSAFSPPSLAQQGTGTAEVADSLVYTGRLEFLGQPVTRLIDLRLVPYGTATGGDPLSLPLEHTQILPVDGWFEVLLDLPAAVLAGGQPMWLQIAVRPSNVEEPYVVLEPRQLLTIASDRSLRASVQTGVADPNANPSALSEAPPDVPPDVPPQPGSVSPSSPDGLYQVSQDGIETTGQPGILPDDGVLPPELEFKDWEDDGNAPQGCGWTVVSGGLQTYCHVGIGAAPGSRDQLVVIANDEERAITAGNTKQSGIAFGTVSSANSSQGRGVLGIAWSQTGPTYGILGRAKSSTGYGVGGYADSTTGVNYGVLGRTASPDGFGGYFIGPRNYFSGRLGIGISAPEATIHVAEGTSGMGVILPGFRVEQNSNSPNLIGGYSGNAINGGHGNTIGGGGDQTDPNTITDPNTSWYATIGGGRGNTINAPDAMIAGGHLNQVDSGGDWGTIGGGQSNTVSGGHATIAGGHRNEASGDEATVGGGDQNRATGNQSTVCGGDGNIASGNYSFVAGGRINTASGNYSFAAGRDAEALHEGTFVWSDTSSGNEPASTAPNQWIARASGGVWFFTNASMSTGVTLASGSGTWSSLSDRNVKENFVGVDGQKTLALLATIPIQTWNYKSQASSIRHIGPMAQDFYAAFNVGEDDRHITTIDSDGVALAAIQGLYELVKEKDEQISALQDRLASLEAAVAEIQSQTNATAPLTRSQRGGSR